jgi:hypothetical protein
MKCRNCKHHQMYCVTDVAQEDGLWELYICPNCMTEVSITTSETKMESALTVTTKAEWTFRSDYPKIRTEEETRKLYYDRRINGYQ